MRPRPPTGRPDLQDPELLQVIADAERILGEEHVEKVGVAHLDGVAHTRGDCPYTPTIDGILPRPGATLEGCSVREAVSMEQCRGCAAGLRRGGMTAIWLLKQLDPISAAAAAADGRVRRGDAIRRCHPTGLLRPVAIARLLRSIGGDGRPAAGPLYLIDRNAALPTGLEQALEEGFHSPDGLSLVGDRDGSVQRIGGGRSWLRRIGRADEADIRPGTARLCLQLAGERTDTEGLWETAVALMRP